jgi:hypothetical protein
MSIPVQLAGHDAILSRDIDRKLVTKRSGNPVSQYRSWTYEFSSFKVNPGILVDPGEREGYELPNHPAILSADVW